MVEADFTALAAAITGVIPLVAAGAVAVLTGTLALSFGIRSVKRYLRG
jgi:hypothetical protein